MQSRKYYEAYWSQYDDVVTLNEFVGLSMMCYTLGKE